MTLLSLYSLLAEGTIKPVTRSSNSGRTTRIVNTTSGPALLFLLLSSVKAYALAVAASVSKAISSFNASIKSSASLFFSASEGSRRITLGLASPVKIF